jgi:hypothetical protein
LFSPSHLFDEVQMSNTIWKRHKLLFIRRCLKDHDNELAGFEIGDHVDGMTNFIASSDTSNCG